MDGLILVAAALVCVCIVLPIVAFVRTNRIGTLEQRVAGLEAALLRLIQERGSAGTPAVEPRPVLSEAPVAVPAAPPPVVAESVPASVAPRQAEPRTQSLEAVIGQKWVGWIAVLLIFCAAAYFLKYAFENRWIGELGRVTIGVVAGLALAFVGQGRYRRGWRYMPQVLTSGGVILLYLSVYGAFGYYHLLSASGAFVFLVILVVEAHLLALAYDARPIAVMALMGGFLAPVLLSTGRDQYAVLFTYIGILDLGMLGVVMARQWVWIGSLAYAATQCLFWAWYGEHYHPEKRTAVLVFQTAIFVLFLLADLGPSLRRRAAGWEEWIRLAVNPFVFYATCYFLLNDDHHDWMAALALGMALVYAGAARAQLALAPRDRRVLLVTVGTALAFVTAAIPIQLEANWITIAWGLEGVALLWASVETATRTLRLLSGGVMAMALFRFLVWDTPWEHRAPFLPVFNRYFLGVLALSACLAWASWLYRRLGAGAAVAAGVVSLGVLWLGSSVEAYTYFSAQAQSVLSHPAGAGLETPAETAKQLRWAGQLALSMLWSVFAGLMTAAGFRLDLRASRVAGLALFGLTLVKVVFLDISELQQFYRIVALLALGVVLLGVAWKYQRGLRREPER